MKASKLTLVAAIILTLTSCSQQQKPNVLFIIVDDLGYHDLSCTGSKFYETPNVDRIAEQGMQFTQGYANCRVCSPSRASIMTGMFTATHGITDWIGAKSGEAWREKKRYSKLLPAEYKHSLNHDYTTIAEAFKAGGYTTFFAGKWHIGDEGSYPEDHGFDINIGGYHAGSPKGGYYSPYNNPKMEDGKPGENLSVRLAKETAQFIESKKDEPFFAVLAFYAVHGPIQTTKEKWAKYQQKATKEKISEEGYINEKYLPIRIKQDNPIYAGLVESMDDGVGIVLDKLEELGIDDNTIVVFTGDNGGVASGDAFSTSNLPLRGGKGYQWEGGTREPYFIKAPHLKAVGQCDFPVIGSDFYPTLLELTGIEYNQEEIDGKSLVPLLKGESMNERPLFWHYPHYGNQGGSPSSVIRKGNWKLIHYYEENIQELYNLKNDPWEQNNVADLNPSIAKDLHQELFDFLHASNAKFPQPDPIYDAEAEQKHLNKIKTEFKERLEKQRKTFLSPDFDPKNDWWGSQTED